jgi:RecB family exonuclease
MEHTENVMPRYSATQIQMYRDCRRRYYDRYVAKTAVDTLDTSAFFGTALHKAIELYFLNGDNPKYTLKHTLQEKFDNATADITMRMSYSAMIEKGNAILDALPFTELALKYTETKIELPFPAEHAVCTMVFVIDGIDFNDNVYDFKSSSKAPTKKALSENIQFNLYWYAYTQYTGKPPNSLTWYHLRDNTRVVFNPESHERVMGEITETVKQMIADTYSDIQPGMCDHCVPWCHRNGTI